jgi:hypothetical protein
VDDQAGYFGRTDEELERLLPESLRIIRVPVDASNRFGKLGRRSLELAMGHSRILELKGLEWVARANAAAAELNWFRGFDWLITDSSPVVAHLVGLEIKRHNAGIRWLQHYSDPFLDPIYARYHPLGRAVDSHFARRFVENATAVSVPCVEMKNFMQAQWSKKFDLAQHPKVLIVPHTYDVDLFGLAGQRYGSTFESAGVAGHPFRISYIGHFYGKRSVAPLLRLVDVAREAAGRLSGRRIEFHLFGSVGWRDLRRLRGCPFVIRHRPVSYLASLAAMHESDALIVIDASAHAGAVHFPSKLADYLGAGRPIIALTPPGSPTERIARECGHFTATPWAEDIELETALRFCLATIDHDSYPWRTDQYDNGMTSMSALLDAMTANAAPSVHE